MVRLPPWHGQKNVKRKSQKKENQVAKEIGGNVTKGSGNTFTDKGDIKLDDYLIEHKYTEGKSYSLTKQTFDKIEREAQAVAKLPAMIIEIQNRKLVVLRYEDII